MGMASVGVASVGVASVGMGSVGSVRSVRLMRLRMGLVGVSVGDVRSVLSLVLGVIGVGVVHGLLVRNDSCWLGFSKDAAVNYRCGTCVNTAGYHDRVTQDVFKGHCETGLSPRMGHAHSNGGTS